MHALFGENGAGKSTLISILSGAVSPSAGHIERDGCPVIFNNVKDARDQGVSAVFQEFSLVPQMTLEENLFLGEERCKGLFLDRTGMRLEAKRILAELAFDLAPDRTIQFLSRAEQQMAEIAKALRSDLRVLILDEPTASLTDHEAEQLFILIKRLTSRGVGIIYITHRMAEIRAISNRITILRDGQHVQTIHSLEADEDRLLELMTGRKIGTVVPDTKQRIPGDEVLHLNKLSTLDRRVRDVSLSVSRGEIVGLAGLVGSGKSETMQAAFGVLPVTAGQVIYKGKEITNRSPAAAIRDGFLYLPADRHHEGLLMVRSVRENMSLASLDTDRLRRGKFLNLTGEKILVAELSDQLNLSPNLPERTIEHFSGGNQQKVMLARSLTRDIELAVFDEPTVGVDIATRQAIYRFILDLAEGGTAVIIVSSDLPEILKLAERAYVFYRGRIQALLHGDALTEENITAEFFEKESV